MSDLTYAQWLHRRLLAGAPVNASYYSLLDLNAEKRSAQRVPAAGTFRLRPEFQFPTPPDGIAESLYLVRYYNTPQPTGAAALAYGGDGTPVRIRIAWAALEQAPIDSAARPALGAAANEPGTDLLPRGPIHAIERESAIGEQSEATRIAMFLAQRGSEGIKHQAESFLLNRATRLEFEATAEMHADLDKRHLETAKKQLAQIEEISASVEKRVMDLAAVQKQYEALALPQQRTDYGPAILKGLQTLEIMAHGFFATLAQTKNPNSGVKPTGRRGDSEQRQEPEKDVAGEQAAEPAQGSGSKEPGLDDGPAASTGKPG